MYLSPKKKFLFEKVIFISEKYLDEKRKLEMRKDRIIESQTFCNENIGNAIIIENNDFEIFSSHLKTGFYEDTVIKLFWKNCFLLTESSRYRKNEPSYFTFSPFQDTQKYFLNFSVGKSIKKQLCIRYINKLDLTNPRNMNVHYCYSFQNYEYMNQSNIILDVVNALVNEFHLQKEKVEIHIPDSCLYLKSTYENAYITVIRPDAECEANLDLPGIHRYIYVCYRYYGQRLFFVNFVLVNIRGEYSKLDSIIYQERLGVLSEGVRYIMQQKKYKNLVKLISGKNKMKQRALHELGNHLITIFTLYDLGIRASNKGVGNELRRKIKSLLILQKYYYPESDAIKNIYLVSDEVKKIFGLLTINNEVTNDFIKEYKKISEKLNENLERYNKHKEKYSISQAITSLGIPKEEFGMYKESTIGDYSFDD